MKSETVQEEALKLEIDERGTLHAARHELLTPALIQQPVMQYEMRCDAMRIDGNNANEKMKRKLIVVMYIRV